MWNQTIETITETCILESANNTFCAEKQIISEKTYNYFDFFVYLGILIIPLAIIRIFIKKK